LSAICNQAALVKSSFNAVTISWFLVSGFGCQVGLWRSAKSSKFDVGRWMFDFLTRKNQRTKPRSCSIHFVLFRFRVFVIQYFDQPQTTGYGSPSHLLTFCCFPTPDTRRPLSLRFSLLLTAYYGSVLRPLASVLRPLSSGFCSMFPGALSTPSTLKFQ